MAPKTFLTFILIFAGALWLKAADLATDRKTLAEAILEEDLGRQIELIGRLSDSSNAVVGQTLTMWRQGGVFILETNSVREPFVLETQASANGQVKGVKILTGENLRQADGTALLFNPNDLIAVETSSKSRKALKAVLDLFAISGPDPKLRRDAVIKLGQEQNLEYLPHFEARLKVENDAETQRALKEAIALTQLAVGDEKAKIEALGQLQKLRSITSISFLQTMEKEDAKLKKLDAPTKKALHEAVVAIEDHQAWGNLVGTAFRGLSTAAVLLVAALGLAITFGLMGVINMAHGEVMMVGAYTTFVVQNFFRSKFGDGGLGFEAYFIAALGVSFVTGALVGLVLERGVIRFLYKRPLESLLATWGVSLILQQVFRQIFGAANVQVGSPRWLSGSFVLSDILFGYNRLFVIGFAFATVIGTYLLLTKTSLGLQIRAVMQNRSMAACIGVRTDRVNMMTFAFGSGLAGMAGACLSQIGNVGPSLGQNYIVDCFMVVVLGGVGNLIGTISAALGVGVTDQILQPWLGAVMGKICVLGAIILFLQWRPSGLFSARGRSLED